MNADIKNIIKILLFINLLQPILATYCKLKFSNVQWINDSRLLLTKGANNQYQLLREQTIPINNALYMVCEEASPPLTVNCKKNKQFNQQLPLDQKCDENNSIKPIRISKEATYCPYTLYQIGFNIQINSPTKFYETYQVCFDHTHMRTLFTINKAYPVAGKRPELKFNPDDIFYGALFNVFRRDYTFPRFQKLLGDNQPYMDEHNLDHRIDRGHLTPSGDFITTNLKRATFSMINVIPQFKAINNGNWRRLEEWARDETRAPAHICNGVLDCNLNSNDLADLNCILQLKGVKGQMVPMFLADNRKIPIPLWLYKVVISKNNDHNVFLTYNNIYHKGNIKPPSRVCKEVKCPLELNETIAEGRTFCCNYEEFMIKAVPPTLKGICETY